jgi:hypothetical protein
VARRSISLPREVPAAAAEVAGIAATAVAGIVKDGALLPAGPLFSEFRCSPGNSLSYSFLRRNNPLFEYPDIRTTSTYCKSVFTVPGVTARSVVGFLEIIVLKRSTSYNIFMVFVATFVIGNADVYVSYKSIAPPSFLIYTVILQLNISARI